MSTRLSTSDRVWPDKSKAQWVSVQNHRVQDNGWDAVCQFSHVTQVPLLMPGTIIFVHGVNSEGEWYREAADQFCEGLNERLGRNDLDSGGDKGYDSDKYRFYPKDKNGKRYRRPIIPFYWGYKLESPDDLRKYPGLYHEEKDKAWGGGAFQNGTNNLPQFWQKGFQKNVLGIVSMEFLNPEFDRQLYPAPPRHYYVHAAERLALLIDTIREDFPNEPVNIVSHSQGTMITLCAILFMKQRAPDTLILNNSPYAFDLKVVMDSLTADKTQGEVARFMTFKNIADKIARAKTDFKPDAEESAECKHKGIEGSTCVYVHCDPAQKKWHHWIGHLPVNEQGEKWHESEAHARDDNRGKVFVNSNPHDRVIAVTSVTGIGWQGIPEALLNPGTNKGKYTMPDNVFQRIFARNSGHFEVAPAVGKKQGYWFYYFYVNKAVAQNVRTTFGKLETSDGEPVQTVNDYLITYDEKPAYKFWHPPVKRAIFWAVQDTPAHENIRIWINAPTVPEPAILDDDFDQGEIQFDGLEEGFENAEQQRDFEVFCRHFVPKDATTDVILEGLAKKKVPQTDHGQILRYRNKDTGHSPVKNVLSYDLTVGPGYAFEDEAYWQYLLKLADWKMDDPYYHPSEPGSYSKLPEVAEPPEGMVIAAGEKDTMANNA